MVDIDECKDRKKYKCEGKCKNTIGDYECKCPLGMRGDGKISCQGFRVTTIVSGMHMIMTNTGSGCTNLLYRVILKLQIAIEWRLES